MSSQTLEILLKARDEATKVVAALQKTTNQLAADTSRFATKARADTNALFSAWAGHNVQLTKGQEALQQSLGATAKAVGMLGAAVAGAGAAIVAMGLRGADVADVEEQFGKLTKAAGQTPAVLNSLSAAFGGTISKFELMKVQNQVLGQGLKLTESQMVQTAQGARVLADRIGGDAKAAYETLTSAMATGQDRMLKTIGLNIDGVAALEKYAAANQKAAKDLTEAEQIEAKRIAILAELSRQLQVSGGVQNDFADNIAAAKATVTDWVDALSKAIATSPALNTALQTVTGWVQKAFGGDQAALVQTLVGHVNAFAQVMVQVASATLSAAGFIGKAFYGLDAVFNAVIGGMVKGLAETARQLEELTAPFAKIPAAAAAMNPFVNAMRDIGIAMKGMSAPMQAWASGFQKNVEGSAKAMLALDQKVDAGKAALADLGRSMTDAAKGSLELAGSLAGGGSGGGSTGGGGVAGAMAVTAQWTRVAGLEMTKFIEKGRELNHLDLKPMSNLPSQNFTGSFDLTAGPGAAFATSFRDSISAAFKNLPQTIMSALQGGGNVLKSVGSMFGASIFGADSGFVKSATAGLTKFFGSEGLGKALGSLIPGLGSILGAGVGGLIGKLFGGDKNKKELADLRAQLLDQFGGSMDALRKKAAALGVDISKAFSTKNPKELKATIDQLNDAMEAQARKIEALGIAAQGFVGLAKEWGKEIAENGATDELVAQFDRLGLYATAIFAGIVRETGDVIGAFKQMGEGLAEMRKGQEEFGLKASETTQKLLDLYGVVENNEGAANALSFLNQVMQGLADGGMRTQQLFNAFGVDAVEIFKDLVAGGASADQALGLMQPTLQRLWEMQRDYGYEVDENTQKLIDQAEEQGLVGDQMRSVNDKILQVLLAIGDALGAAIPDALRKTGDAAVDEFGRFRDAAREAGEAMPTGEYEPKNYGSDYGLPGYATGGRVPYTPGGKAVRVAEEQTENILTDGQLAGLMKRAGVSGGGMPTSLTINLNADGHRLGTYVVKLTNEGMADGRIRVPSRAIAERNG